MAKKKSKAAATTVAESLEVAETKGAISVWTQRARGIGLLLGFAVAFAMSYRAGLPVVDSALRGVLGAVVMSLLLWWCALIIIQGLIRTALVRRNEERQKAYDEVIAAQEAAAAAKAAEQEQSEEDYWSPSGDV